MKKIIIPTLALALASCGGGTTTQNTATDTTAATTTTAPAPTTEDNDVVDVSKLPKQFVNFLEKLPESPAHSPRKNVAYQSFNEEVGDDKIIYYTFCAFPKKDGGYIDLCAITEYNQGCFVSKSFDTYIDNGDKMKRIHNVLPIPPLNADSKAGNEADFNACEAIYKQRPLDFIYYNISLDGAIRAILTPPTGDDPKWKDEYYQFLDQNYDPPTYRWDGEKFVQFDMFADYLKGLPKSPDKPVYHFGGEYGTQDMFCSIILDYYAFPMKDGGYMAIRSFNEQCEASMWWNDATYTYKNDKLQGVGNILPVPEMITLLDPEKCKGKDDQVKDIINQYNGNPREYLLYIIKDDGTMDVSAEGNGCEQWGECDLDLMVNATYKWDGEKFVRTDKNANAASADNEVAKEIFKKEFPSTKKIEWYKDDPLKCYGYPEVEGEGCGAGESLACFPLKDGGYLVTFASSFCGPGCADEYQFWTKKYIDGKLTDVNDILPIPTLEELLNPDKAKNYQSDIAKFKKEFYDKKPEGVICYEFQPPETITIRLHPWDCENAYYNMDKVMLDPYNDDQVPTYKWDGEKFVKQQ